MKSKIFTPTLISFFVIVLNISLRAQCDVPVADACKDAIDFGLVSTITCDNAPMGYRLNGCLFNATPDERLDGCGEFLTTGTVWYRTKIDADARVVMANVLPSSAWHPRIAMYEGDSCDSLTLMSDGCSSSNGVASNVKAVVNQTENPDTSSVWIAVSYDPYSVNAQSDLNFTIEIIAEDDCLQCGAVQGCVYLGQEEIRKRSIIPLSDTTGKFYPGEQVEVCLYLEYDASVTGYDWLQCLIPKFGKGWDLENSNLGDARTSPGGAEWVQWNSLDCAAKAGITIPQVKTYYDESGQLQFSHNCIGHPNVAKEVVQGDVLPSCWFYSYSAADCPNSGCSPSEYWGLFGSSTLTSVEICLNLKVKEDFGSSNCTEDRALDIVILPTSDAMTGCWSGEIACPRTDVYLFGENWEIDCHELPEIQFSASKEVCDSDTVRIDVIADSLRYIEVYAEKNQYIDRISPQGIISNDAEYPTLSDTNHFTISEVLVNLTDIKQIQRYKVRSISENDTIRYIPYEVIDVILYPKNKIEIVNEDSLRIFDKIITTGDTTQYVELGNSDLGMYSNVMWEPDSGLIVHTYQDGSTKCQLDGLRTAPGQYNLVVHVTDTLGCVSTDTLHAVFGMCGLQPYVTNFSCFDLGTSNESDDLYYFDLTVTGDGAMWGVSGEPSLSSYGSTMRIGPESRQDGYKKVTVYDADNESCSIEFEISPPDDCEMCNAYSNYETLMKLYFATEGHLWKNNEGWNSAVTGANCDPCNGWYGISCDTNGRITRLDLNYNNLRGSFPSEIGMLTSLEYLDLSNNLMYGSIPSTIGDLTALNYLNLHNNSFEGSMIKSVGNLTNLNSLKLSANRLSGSLPEELGNLIHLKDLNLQENQFSGCIPPSLLSFICGIENVDFSGNPMLPWEGDLDDFCATDGSAASQQGAPCMVNGEAGGIDENCMCRPMDGLGNTDISTVLIYPNPSRNRVFVEGLEGVSYEIHSIQGKRMASGVYNHEAGILIKDLSSGIYILRVQTAKGWSLGRFVKE